MNACLSTGSMSVRRVGFETTTSFVKGIVEEFASRNLLNPAQMRMHLGVETTGPMDHYVLRYTTDEPTSPEPAIPVRHAPRMECRQNGDKRSHL